MKLVLAIIEDELAFQVAKALVQKGIRSTKLSSSGGFLKKGNTTLLIGTEDHKVDEVIGEIRIACASSEDKRDENANEFAANIFILPINEYIRM